MGTLEAGTVVLVPFPFSDLSNSKLRPAVVLADVGRGDFVLCQITSKSYSDERAVEIGQQSFSTGSLRITSFARPGKLFTANENLFTQKVGTLSTSAFRQIINAVVTILQQGSR
jgi:mRNA interferase MazF